MLRALCLELAAEMDAVSVIARNPQRLRALQEEAAGRGGVLHPEAVDYGYIADLDAALGRIVGRFGAPSLVVAYVHSHAPQALEALARWVSHEPPRCRFFHVRGSAAADPTRTGDELRDRILSAGTVLYRQVILGFVVEGGRSRWLTHEEISRGVADAIRANADRYIVGTVEPWSLRP